MAAKPKAKRLTHSQVRRLDKSLRWILKFIEENISEEIRATRADHFKKVRESLNVRGDATSESVTAQATYLVWAYTFMTQHYEGGIEDKKEMVDTVKLMTEMGMLKAEKIQKSIH